MGKLSTLFDKRKKSSSASSDDHRRTEPDGTADDDSDAGEYVEVRRLRIVKFSLPL